MMAVGPIPEYFPVLAELVYKPSKRRRREGSSKCLAEYRVQEYMAEELILFRVSGVTDLVDSAANFIARRVDKLKEGGCIS
jgi:hypothetical protein